MVKLTEEIIKNKQLMTRHYLRKANRPDYWFSFYLKKGEGFRNKYKDNFYFIIYQTTNNFNYYAIPYVILKPLINEDTKYIKENRCIGTINNHELKVRKTNLTVDVQKFYNLDLDLAHLKLEYPTKNSLPISEESFHKREEEKLKRVSTLSFEELLERIIYLTEIRSITYVLSKKYERNENVTEYALRRANGFCQLCGNPAPFTKKDGNPYLEVHHIQWLSEGGKDTIENTVALCPNCHRKMHILNLNNDKAFLYNLVTSS